jgi:hypothetical protein
MVDLPFEAGPMRTFFLILLVFAFFAPAGGQQVAEEALTIATASPEWRQASVGRPWSLPLEAAGAAGPVDWVVAEGALPPGIRLVDASMVMLGAAPGAVLYGAPGEPGAYWALLRARDADGRQAEAWIEVKVSLLSLKETAVPAFTGKSLEWRAEPLQGVAPFAQMPAPEAFLPLGLSVSPDGTITGDPLIPGRYELPWEVRDAGGNVLRTSLTLGVYGPESALPPVAVRFKRDACRLTAEWTPLPENIQVMLFGGEGDVPLEIEITHLDTSERVRAVYPTPNSDQSPCPSDPQP